MRCAEQGYFVLLQWLWEWKGSVQREERARQGCLSVCAQSFKHGCETKKAHTDPHPMKSEWDSAVSEGFGGVTIPQSCDR